jgi:hypothetical protein
VPRLLTIVWFLAGAALALSLFRAEVFREARPLKIAPALDPWTQGGFTDEGVSPNVDRATLPRGLRVAGSWVGNSEWRGDAATAWTRVTASGVRVYVAGFPNQRGCSLTAEFRAANGAVTSSVCGIRPARPVWRPWDLAIPAGAVEMRLVAKDDASEPLGWFAFTEPSVKPVEWPQTLFATAQIFTTLALALTLLWGPGLVWAPTGASPVTRVALVLGGGPLLLATVGVAAWFLYRLGTPAEISRVAIWLLWLGIGASLSRRKPPMSRRFGTALGISALVAFATVAKASFSGGPEAELFGGTISRTLAVGDRSDARIPYHVLQVIANRFNASEDRAEVFFQPWTFFSRGPLAGFVSAPVVLGTGGTPPRDFPMRMWSPFDQEGYAAYRIVMMTLASGVILALFVTVSLFASEAWALIAAGMLALTPFGVHEVMFTWPKLEATTWLLISFALVHQRLFIPGGLAFGLGYLFHPLVLLWVPWFALWAAGRQRSRSVPAAVYAIALFGVSLAIIVVPWILIGANAPHSDKAPLVQTSFIDYFYLTDTGWATWSTWWQSRWNNFANTFLPFWLYTVNFDSQWTSSVFVRSGALVRFSFGWWNTLPLGIGLGLFGLSLVVLARVARHSLRPFLVLVVGPALLLVAYWGSYSSGLMRECGHPLLAAWIGLTCVELSRSTGRLSSFVARPLFPWLQLPEVLLMLWLTTLLNPARERAAFDPLYLALSVLALGGTTFLLARVRTIDATELIEAERSPV